MILLDIPTSIACEVLTDWLKTHDIGRIDAALCNRTSRPAFLELLKERAVVSLGQPSTDIEDSCLSWLFSRRVQLLSMSISDPDVNLTVQDCEVFRSLGFLDIYYRHRLKLIMDACKDSLKVLILRGCEINIDEAVGMASQCRNLHTLEIGELTKYMGRRKPRLQTLLHREARDLPVLCAATLRSFVCNWTGVSDSLMLRVVSSCKQLTRLELTGHNITNKVVYSVISNCRDLRIIRLIKCQWLTTDGIVALASYNQLEVLDLNGSGGVTTDSVVPIITNNPQLHTINLRHGNAISSLAVMKIAATCPGLTALDVSYCKFVKDDAMYLIANKCSQLQDLQVCGCESITDMSMLRLANLCPKLTSINIKDCPSITKVTTEAFAFSGVRPYKKSLR